MPTVIESLNRALEHALAHDQRIILIGEDILDPYSGAFKVTRGLSTAFPDRVLTTPVSEAGIVGIAIGMALRGLRPVVEIMFGDFLTLAADQLINHAAKFRWMYNNQVSVPLVVRTPMGGRRGYGPTHSQTLEKLFLGVPGLRVLAPCAFSDPGDLLEHAILDDDPVIFIENKLLYYLSLQDDAIQGDLVISPIKETSLPVLPTPNHITPSPNSLPMISYAPSFSITIRDAPPPVLTITAYGYMAELSRQAILQLAYDHEIFVELVVQTQLAPFELEAILSSTTRTGRLLTVEEGTLNLGWGTEVIARSAEHLGNHLQVAHRLAAYNLPIPASQPLEASMLPDVDLIVETARKMVL